MGKNIIGLIITIIAFLLNFFGPLIYTKKGGTKDDFKLKIKAVSLIVAVIGMIIVFI